MAQVDGYGLTATAQSSVASESPRRWLLLGLLSAAMCVSFIDRYALSMLVTPIKAALGLSDTSIGLLTGFAFSAFYSTFGIVMARMSDFGRHRAIIVLSLLVWSAMTALSGAAQNLWQISLARFGVGAGEAGVAPTSHAVLSSVFPAHLRSGALAAFSAAGPLGILLAFAITGHLYAIYGWRWTFAILGMPGIVLALCVMLTRKDFENAVQNPRSGRSIIQTGWLRDMLDLTRIPRFRAVSITIGLLGLLTFGQTQWLPAYVQRSFGLSLREVGPLLALTQGAGMLIGMVFGGVLFDSMARKSEHWRTRLLVLTMMLGFPIVLAVYCVNDGYLAARLSGIAAFVLAMPSGQLFAEVQSSVPPLQRATGAATAMTLSSIFGLGLGPLLIGWLSDLLEPHFGLESLRYGLIVTIGMSGICLVISTFVLVGRMRAGKAA